jgi:uroporphyrinogen decarboxylase
VAVTHRERIQAVLAGERVDRPPFALWHHFRPAGSPEALAEATVAFFGSFDFDLFKVMPDLPYPAPAGTPLRGEAAWRAVPRLEDPLAGMVEAVRATRRRVPGEVVVATVFSPLALALRFAGGAEAFLAEARAHPAAVAQALEAVAEGEAASVARMLAAGADGVYFATAGQGEGFPAEAYRTFGRPYDLRVLEAARDGWCNVLHMHAVRDLDWRPVLDYPVPILSWSDRLTGVTLDEVLAAAPGKVVMGGIQENGAVVRRDEAALWAEMQDAVRRGAGRLLLAGGCSVPDDIDPESLRLARRLVDRLAG